MMLSSRVFRTGYLFSERSQNMEKNRYSLARTIAECAVMVALAVILSILKLADLPYGGSITMASKLPLIIIGYRHGIKWGFVTSFVYGAMELVLGLNTLSYVTGVASVIAVILLDYIVAFGVIGLSALVRNAKTEKEAFVFGSLIACFARYICHVISGATVWAGLSIPTAAALSYSLIYNATYMVPETLILAVAAYFVGSSIDFGSDRPKPVIRKEINHGMLVNVMKYVTLTFASAALVIDIVCIFSKLQNAETGEFDITGIADANIPLIVIATSVALAVVIAYCIIYFVSKKKNSQPETTKEENA